MGNRNATNNTDYEDDPMDFDFSNTSFINDIWIMKPSSEIIMETTIFFPVVFFGIFGNISSIYVLIKNKHIRIPTNMLIGNMAIADMLSLLIHPWVFLSYDFFQNYQLGTFGCKTEAAIECSILLSSVISVSAISYDRLTAILLPEESKLTRNGVKIVIAATWIVGLLVSSPLFVYRTYKERQWKDFLEKFCSENSLIINTYYHVIVTALVWLPLIVQLVCYVCIFIKLNKYQKLVSQKLNHRQVNYKKKAIRMMFIVISTFLICRMPFTALIFYRRQLLQNTLSESTQVQNVASGTYHSLWFTSKFFIFMNSALNPLIYSVTNEKFQKAFKGTNLWIWLFPPRNHNPGTAKPKTNQNPIEITPLFKKGIFSIFKRRQKFSTHVTDDTNVSSDDHFQIIKF